MFRSFIQGGAKVINHPMFFCYFFLLMKNVGSACEISLFNPLEFIPSSRENVKTELTFGAICKSYSVFPCGDYFCPTLYVKQIENS